MSTAADAPRVIAVTRENAHRFSKPVRAEIRLVAGHGVQGDAHAGDTVQHRSRVQRDPTQPNLRQVHLIHAELLDEVGQDGFTVKPGQLGENVLTRGLDLLRLPRGTRIRLGAAAEVEVTGLRNPCTQIDGLANGLMKRLVHRIDDEVVRLAGVMAIVLADGMVRPGDPLTLTLPNPPHQTLQPV